MMKFIGIIVLTLGVSVVDSVLAEPQPKTNCDFTISFSRSDFGINQIYYKVVVQGTPGDSFSFKGCSTKYNNGKICLSKAGVSGGARLLQNQNGQIVAEGVCCNNVQNRVISVAENCNSDLSIPYEVK